ncbi:MAG: peroxiredoxin [Verrucomicrobia bacterium 12-59-8]|nr:MAG: peroxiredoxin [Verrucomicrobia bacterium 12-59-8]
MSKHTATVRWKNNDPDFLSRRYSREHTLLFDGGATMPGSPSPQIVPAPWSNPAGIDPEEMFIASVSSCHMLWFLHVACDAGLLPESYDDAAEGIMTKNERGALWISQITLQPRIVWGGDKKPKDTEVEHLHHLAHEQCFIANSIKTKVIVQPRD